MDGGAYSNTSPVFSSDNLPLDYTWDFPVAGGGNPPYMQVARRPYFGGVLPSGAWVDNINVYNGYHTPADLIPEPASLLLMVFGFVPALRRRSR